VNELKKNIAELVDAINTKSDKEESCAKLAQLFFDEKEEISFEFINKTIQDIDRSYRIVFITKWCLIYVSDGQIDHSTDIVKEFVNKKNILGDHFFAQGKIFCAIAADLPDKFISSFPSIIAEALAVAKQCENSKENYKVLKDIVFLFRKKDIQDKQVISVLRHISDPDTKNWSIWAMIGQNYPGKNYRLRFKMIIEYEEYNHEVLFGDLHDLFEDIIADKEMDGSKKKELLDEYSVLTYETTYSKSLKERILLKIKSVKSLLGFR
jgi:hypothetical protein